MKCPFCEHSKAHKHGVTSKGSQRFRCPVCHQSFTDTFDTLYYRRQVSPDEIEKVLQSHAEGCSYRGIARIHGLAYDTVVSLICEASERSQLLHNQAIQDIESHEIIADEMWSFVQKNKSTAFLKTSSKGTVG